MAYYLRGLSIRGEINLELIQFLDFLFKNGARLDGVLAVKDLLLRQIAALIALGSDALFDLLVYLLEVQQFKLDEPLTLIHYSLKTVEGKKIDQAVSNETKRVTSKSDSIDLMLANPDKRYYEYKLKPHTCYFSFEAQNFFYVNHFGVLVLNDNAIERILQLKPIFNLCDHRGVVATAEQVEGIKEVRSYALTA